MIDEKKLIAETARRYAESLILYGVDVTKQWETATSQHYALERAYMKGKNDAFNKMWIPCSERLPEEGKSVLISTKTSDRVYVGLYTKRYGFEMSEGFICADGFMWLNTATAWMPLPESFKESEE